MATETARELLFDKGATICNISNYSYGLERNAEKMRIYSENLQVLADQIEKGLLQPTSINVISQLSAETVAKAHKILENNQTFGKKLIMEIN